MTYLTYLGERTFQDEMADCGEFGGRMCGISGSVCRERQNSFALLTERLGRNPAMPDDSVDAPSHEAGGCSAGRGGEAGLVVIVLAGFAARRRTRSRRHRALLQ
jgi:hypothetical protein